MKNRRVVIAAVCLLALLLVWNTWGLFSVTEHDCAGDYCFVCRSFSQSNEILKLFWYALWMLSLIVLLCITPRFLQAHTRGMLMEFSTPIRLRDKLSN